MASNDRSRRVFRYVSLLVVAASSLGCPKAADPPRAEAPRAEAPRAEAPRAEAPRAEAPLASADVKKSLAPSTLAVCGTDDPLSALCNLGAESARFECESPEPLQFCAKGTEWVCRHMGEEPPAVTYRARFDQQGPRLKGGEMVDVSKFKREGKVRGVAIQVAASDEKIAQSKVEEITNKLVAWGCVLSQQQRGPAFSCETWEARVRYSSVIDRVIFEAAENGFLECQ